MTRHVASAIAQAYDFSGKENVIDLGGGQGSLMAAILTAHRASRGTVLDLEHCKEGAKLDSCVNLLATWWPQGTAG
ncbi:MAG TPA: methyltransferase [Acidobacteriota bacterium]|nr:methyltransferase [Acidobacteriota bacterium]